MHFKFIPPVGSSPILTISAWCKVARTLKLQIAKIGDTSSIFGQTKYIAHVSFLYFTLNTNSN